MLSLLHFEPPSPCEKFCAHMALNLALLVNKADLEDLQFPMSCVRMGCSLSYVTFILLLFPFLFPHLVSHLLQFTVLSLIFSN